ncbi:MAG: type II toxin-antitoxin system Phd/YefM family antitoxin [Xenococcus sp. MO_188.B8]|nr:type II toxin-antitoxin system Phd/YefM family antitoxin [Xenococcus sp. MO_188.B8]
MIELHPEFIFKNGKKEFAVLPYEEFLKLQEILEDLEDLRDLRLAEEEDQNNPDYSLDKVREMLDIKNLSRS